MSDTRCPVCDDDGWIDVLDDEGFPVSAMDCPRLDDPGHAAFNASELIPASPDNPETGAANERTS